MRIEESSASLLNLETCGADPSHPHLCPRTTETAFTCSVRDGTSREEAALLPTLLHLARFLRRILMHALAERPFHAFGEKDGRISILVPHLVGG